MRATVFPLLLIAIHVSTVPGQDFGFDVYTGNASNAADVSVAAGLTCLVYANNERIGVVPKDGTKELISWPQTGEDDIWGNLTGPGTPPDSAFDPEGIWDPFAQRFLIVTCLRTGANAGGDRFGLAVSKTSLPSQVDSWWIYGLPWPSLFPSLDSANIAVDQQFIYLWGDQLGAPAVDQLHVYPKSPFLSGQPAPAPVIVNFPQIVCKQSRSCGTPIMYGSSGKLFLVEPIKVGPPPPPPCAPGFVKQNVVIVHYLSDFAVSPATHLEYQIQVPDYYKPVRTAQIAEVASQ